MSGQNSVFTNLRDLSIIEYTNYEEVITKEIRVSKAVIYNMDIAICTINFGKRLLKLESNE